MALLKLPAHRLTGHYEPTFVAGTNVISVTLENAFYAVNGQFVQVYSAVEINATTSGFSAFQLTLPFGMDVTDVTDCIGGATTTGFTSVAGAVTANAFNDRAEVQCQVAGSGLSTIFFHFAYIMKP